MFVSCECVGSGLCDELITLSDECYRVSVCVCVCVCMCVIVYDPDTSTRGDLGLSRTVAAQKEKLPKCWSNTSILSLSSNTR
jgi:hypothetical protein